MDAETLVGILTPLFERLIKSQDTIGTSELVSSIDGVTESVTCTNYLLALLVILLIGGWLYSFFKDLFDQV